MTELCDLATKHKTDKVPPYHSYTFVYHDLFHARRFEVRRVFEMGIGTPETMPGIKGYKAGPSLRMWREYFPNAEIFAADIKPAALITEDRITSYICDQGNITSLIELANLLGRDFDLMIDDGSHITNHQIATARVLAPLLAPGGKYIIEDVCDATAVVNGLPMFACETINFPDEGPCKDNRLVIIST